MARKTNIEIPEKPSLEGLEQKWSSAWEQNGVFRFDRSKSRDEIYSIDTPPPTVSGSLHIGHCFSYTHTDLIARFQRMNGKEVFYPMGWDDNGLNTERRVQLMLGIKCDPSLPYDPNFSPPANPPKDPIAVSRPNFVEQCKAITEQMEQAYYHLWSTLGLSVDWTMTYTTIGDKARRASQRGFLHLKKQNLVYSIDAPTLWDVQYKTAVAQAELEDREIPGTFYRLAFHRADGGPDVLIDTTRPELVAADVAVLVHPDDDRYRDLVGKELLSPMFGARLPVFAHQGADPEKGTGVVMVSTWGDLFDVAWWRELKLPTRQIIADDGRLAKINWGSPGWECVDPVKAQSAYDKIAGLPAKIAQKKIAELLKESGELVEEPRSITHPVKFWENGDSPLEVIARRQWYIKVLGSEPVFLQSGNQLTWHPEYMKVRLENWINGLNQDWNISRQRFFGVPFPVWYPLSDDATPDYDNPITPDESTLPIDPSSDVPSGFTADQRGKPGGFIGDPDVMDTWATSSITPLIVCAWEDDDDLFSRTFPMDLRPQAHEIIRTWLFYTLVRAEYEFHLLPWNNAAISGFVVDPDRKKISKSKGNAEDQPVDLISQYGADAVRYWAANAAPGLDAPLDHNQFKIGRRLSTKLLNASKFVLGLGIEKADLRAITQPVDQSMLKGIGEVIEEATNAFNQYNYAKAIERIEMFFWNWCDNYLELAKVRAYGTLGDDKAASAQAALALALSVLQRLFAPFLAYTTEEVWSWWQEGSIHRSTWPNIEEVSGISKSTSSDILALASSTLSEVRKAKTEAKQSMKSRVQKVVVFDTAEHLEMLRLSEDDLREAGVIEKVEYVEGESRVDITLDTSAD
jgi:valyl-tRNA synthetase